jgi:hypothetical protein
MRCSTAGWVNEKEIDEQVVSSRWQTVHPDAVRLLEGHAPRKAGPWEPRGAGLRNDRNLLFASGFRETGERM